VRGGVQRALRGAVVQRSPRQLRVQRRAGGDVGAVREGRALPQRARALRQARGGGGQRVRVVRARLAQRRVQRARLHAADRKRARRRRRNGRQRRDGALQAPQLRVQRLRRVGGGPRRKERGCVILAFCVRGGCGGRRRRRARPGRARGAPPAPERWQAGGLQRRLKVKHDGLERRVRRRKRRLQQGQPVSAPRQAHTGSSSARLLRLAALRRRARRRPGLVERAGQRRQRGLAVHVVHAGWWGRGARPKLAGPCEPLPSLLASPPKVPRGCAGVR